VKTSTQATVMGIRIYDPNCIRIGRPLYILGQVGMATGFVG
jgi:hypothetical protein